MKLAFLTVAFLVLLVAVLAVGFGTSAPGCEGAGIQATVFRMDCGAFGRFL